MRKPLLVFGIIILFIGAILAPSFHLSVDGKVQHVRVNASELRYDPTNKGWEVSAYFEEEDVMVVDLTSGDTWGMLFLRAPEGWWEHLEPLNFSIVGPSGGETIFTVYIGGPPDPDYEIDPHTMTLPVGIRDIKLASHGSADLELREPIEIGGVIKKTGEYTVKLKQNEYWDRDRTTCAYWPKEDEPPKEIKFYKEICEKEYPYTFLLPIGALLCVLGATITTLGVKSANRTSQVKAKAHTKR